MRSFVKDAAAATSTPPAETQTQVAPPAIGPAMTVATRTHGAYIEGEIDKSDIRTPFLSCVQNVGPKSQLFQPGTLVLGETAVAPAPAIGAPTARLRVLFLRASKTYVENLPYNPAPNAPRPRIFYKMEEVTAAGLSTAWQNNVPPGAIAKTTCFALVRQPATLEDGQFNIIDGTHTYAPAMVSFQKTSYSAAKTLWTDLSLSLKGDPTNTLYDLFWNREQRGPNLVWVAKLVRVRDEQPSASLKTTAHKLAGGELSFEADATE